MLAHHRRLHDALAVDHGAEPARPGGIDQGGCHRAAIEGRIVTAVQHAVIGHDHADRRVELTEAAQHPVLAHLLVITRDPHRGEQLLGAPNLPVAVLTREGLTRAELARLRYASYHPLGVAGADPIERFAGDDIEIPGLRVHRRRRAYRQADDFLNQLPGYWIGFVTADAAATEDNVIELHVAGIPGITGELAWIFAVSRP